MTLKPKDPITTTDQPTAHQPTHQRRHTNATAHQDLLVNQVHLVVLVLQENTVLRVLQAMGPQDRKESEDIMDHLVNKDRLVNPDQRETEGTLEHLEKENLDHMDHLGLPDQRETMGTLEQKGIVAPMDHLVYQDPRETKDLWDGQENQVYQGSRVDQVHQEHRENQDTQEPGGTRDVMDHQDPRVHQERVIMVHRDQRDHQVLQAHRGNTTTHPQRHALLIQQQDQHRLDCAGARTSGGNILAVPARATVVKWRCRTSKQETGNKEFYPQPCKRIIPIVST